MSVLRRDGLKNIRPVYVFLRFMGIFQLDDSLKLNYLYFVYCLSMNLGVAFKFVESTLVIIRVPGGNSRVATWFACLTALILLSQAVYFVHVIIYRKTLLGICEKLRAVDDILKEKINLKYCYIFFAEMCSDLIYISAIVLLEFIVVTDYKRIFGPVSVFVTVWIYLFLYVKCLYLPIYPLLERIDVLIRATKRKSLAVNLSSLSDSYYTIVDCCKMLDKINGLPILIFVLTYFTQTVLSLYLLYQTGYIYSVEMPNSILLTSGVVVGLTLVQRCFHLFQVVTATGSMSDKAQEFNNRMYKLMIKDETNELCRNKKLKLHISTKKDIVFSAWGFFDLDYTLIHSMVAAASTYIIILIQLVPSKKDMFLKMGVNADNATTDAVPTLQSTTLDNY